MINIKNILKNIRKMIDNENQNELTTLGKISKENDPFRVLISTILSSRTKDDITFNATKRLFEQYKNAKELSRRTYRILKDLSNLLRSIKLNQRK